MMNKRMSKLVGLTAAVDPPVLEGPAEAELTLIAWGSTISPVRDALGILAAKGVSANLVAVRGVYPVNGPAFTRLLGNARKTLLVEGNFSGQFGRLLRAETGIHLAEKLLKYDGEPFYPMEIVGRALEMTGHVGN